MRPMYETQKDRNRERFVQSILPQWKMIGTPTRSNYDFVGSVNSSLDSIFELKARSYPLAKVPQGGLYLTFEKYQNIMQTLVPNKFLLIMNPEGLWIGNFNDIQKSTEDYPLLQMGGRYDRNDPKDVDLHVLFPVNKLTNIYSRQELLKLQDAYRTDPKIYTTEEIQTILSSTN